MNRDIIIGVLSGLLLAAVMLAGCVDEITNNATVTPSPGLSPTLSPTPSSTVPETTWVIASEDELLGEYERSNRTFAKYVFEDMIVYEHLREIDGAIVEGDRILYQFDRDTKELIKKIVQWRDDLPEHLPSVISEEDAESIAKTVGKGKIMNTSLAHTKLLYIALDSCWHPIRPTPENPCWIVYFADENGYNIDVIIIDAVEGKILGHGVPFPSSGFSFSGPQDVPNCTGAWTNWYQNAETWFQTMGYPTQSAVYPSEATVKSHIQSKDTALFDEVAHGSSEYFQNDCSDTITASEIHNWIADYPKMPFTFIHSCGGMCEVGPGTVSYELRKGSTEDTATVGTCLDDNCIEWELEWQDTLFNYMNQGWTVKAAFDQACKDYPKCARCVRFVGDENFKVVPKIGRVSLGEAVDNTDLEWWTGGNSDWFGQEKEGAHDDDAARSGYISNGQSSYLETFVLPGYISFWWKVEGSGCLRFYENGLQKYYLSGDSGDWVYITYHIDADWNTLRWVYTKSGTSDEDCGWLDHVDFYADCPSEYALDQAGVSDSDDVLEPLRQTRDKYMKNEYVNLYYEYSPEIVGIMAKDPALAAEAARLLIKYSPIIGQSVNMIDGDIRITKSDVDELVSFAEWLKRDVLENKEQIGAERSQEIVQFIDEFEAQVGVFEDKTFSEAFQSSIYYESTGVTELNVTPEVVVQGEYITISGKAEPNESVWLQSSFELAVPVDYEGIYYREFNGLDFPVGEKEFSTIAENIKIIRLSIYPIIFEDFCLKVLYPLYAPLNATNGTATITISFPVTWENMTIDIYGEKDVEVWGVAADNATCVNLTTNMSIKVIADSNGDFSLNISTTGVPHGEFPITAGDITRTAQIVDVPLAEALDNEELNWSTGGDANWYGQIQTCMYDDDAAQSAYMMDLQSTYIQTNVTGPGNVTFYWKVSSEANYDFLRFSIDGNEQANISGEVNWHQKSFDIDPGNHTLNWSYTKSEFIRHGDDCGWLDKVIYAAPIATCEDLQNIKNELSSNYYLANDINCSDTVNWNGGTGFEPIGNSSNPFTGTLDGRGYKITGLYINRPSTDFVGLFGRTGSESEIKDVCLGNVSVTGNEYVGGLVGQNRGIITNSSSTSSVTGSGLNFAGGLVGHNYGGTIENCYCTARVSGLYEVGGLVGSNEKPYDGTMARILNSYSMGSVIGTGRVGGLAGLNYWDGEISNSYSHSSVSGDASDIGGLIGEVYGVTVINSYSTDQVTGSGSYVGGLIGYKNHGTITYSYWDTETSRQDQSAGGTGKTTAEMKQQATFVNWNFTDIWDIKEDVTYPYLQWQKVPVASFTYSPQYPTTEDTIAFDASSSYDPDGTIVSYDWDFDDGNISSGEIVTHQYTTVGTYTVTLTVTNNEGATNNQSKDIIVGVTLADALDNEELNWSTGGDTVWCGQTETYVYDNDSAQNTHISNR